jgi:hypothetical protein
MLEVLHPEDNLELPAAWLGQASPEQNRDMEGAGLGPFEVSSEEETLPASVPEAMRAVLSSRTSSGGMEPEKTDALRDRQYDGSLTTNPMNVDSDMQSIY